MKLLKLLVVLLLLSTCVCKAQNADEKSVRQVLTNQIGYWNKGDLENFMQGYWNNDSLLFIGKAGPKYGYKTTLLNYKKGYPNKEAMGILSFDILQIRQLSPLNYFVVGKFHLERTIGNAEGYFTLLFKKINGKWLIVADHSS